MSSIASISGTFELAESATAGVASPGVTVGDAFRTALDALMRTRGLKGVDLSRKTKLSSATITKLKNGERGASFEVLEKLRAAFGVPPSALFDPDSALASLGLARRETDTKTGRSAHVVDSRGFPEVASGFPLEGGAAVVHDPELFQSLVAFWEGLDTSGRLELLKAGHRLKRGHVGKMASG